LIPFLFHKILKQSKPLPLLGETTPPTFLLAPEPLVTKQSTKTGQEALFHFLFNLFKQFSHSQSLSSAHLSRLLAKLLALASTL
jgi:hypothetical protein